MGELKRYVLFLILTGFLGWASCTHYPICQSSIPELAAIDSLLWTQPDSAFAQLLAFADSADGRKYIPISFPSIVRNTNSHVISNTFGDAVFVLFECENGGTQY